jgi:hypothetical protein
VDFYHAWLLWRNTPTSEAGSPSQKLMARRTATKIPTTEKLLKPKVVDSKVVKSNLKCKQSATRQYFRPTTKSLDELKYGYTVRVRVGKQWKPARLLSQNNQPTQPRSYNVETERGNVWRRNRRDLLKTREDHIFSPRAVEDEPEFDRSDAASLTPNQIPPEPPNQTPHTSKPVANTPRLSSQSGGTSKPYQTRTGRVSKLPAHLRSGDYVYHTQIW